MSNDKIDPSSKDPKISSADELTKTTNKSDVELSEEELKRVSGGRADIKYK
jgi:bacteriocin-like protein